MARAPLLMAALSLASCKADPMVEGRAAPSASLKPDAGDYCAMKGTNSYAFKFDKDRDLLVRAAEADRIIRDMRKRIKSPKSRMDLMDLRCDVEGYFGAMGKQDPELFELMRSDWKAFTQQLSIRLDGKEIIVD